MHHIKDDKRTHKSALLIYEGLSTLMEKKPFDKITISDIQVESGVGRATFYRNFDCISDVLHWKCNCCFSELSQQYLNNEYFKSIPHGLAYFFFHYWKDNSKILEELIAINRIDIIYSCHLHSSYDMSDHYHNFKNISHYTHEYFMGIRSGVFISIFLIWLKRGKKETIHDMYEMLSLQLKSLGTPEFSM